MKIAVLSHDAGASELISALVKEYKDEIKCSIFAKKSSPFESILIRENLEFKSLDELNINGFDAFFYGTAWRDKVEYKYVKKAKKLNIPTFAFVDSYSEYRSRFIYDGVLLEPDFTILSDSYALELAYRYNLKNPIQLTNYYIKNLLDTKIEHTPQNKLLFLSEPVKEVALNSYNDENYWGFDELSALEDILKNTNRFGGMRIEVRLHPAQKRSPYDDLIKKYKDIDISVHKSSEVDLNKDILTSNMVIGFNSFVLVISALMGVATISYLPSKNREFLLPLPETHKLRELKLSKIHFEKLNIDNMFIGGDIKTLVQKIKGFKYV